MKRNQKTADMLVKKEKFARVQFPVLLPMNEKQSKLLEALKYNTLVVASGSAGTGKAQPLDSLILTENGFVKMRDIKVGDKVRSIDAWTKVTGVFPQGKKQIVRFKFKDGGEVECCTDHLWTVFSNKQPNGKRKSKSDQVTITAQEVIDLINLKSSGNVSLPVLSAIEYPEKSYNIDPYIVGALIGDGSVSTSSISISNADEEVFDEIQSRLPEDCHLTKNEKLTRYISDSQCTWKVKNRVSTELDNLGLIGKYSYTKFIPNAYKNGSIKQRYDLLKGLMDTDGTVDRQTGAASYCTVSKQLAEDVREVVLSLGGKASITESVKHFTYKGEKKKGLLAYVVSINVPDKKELFFIKRKKELVSNTDITQLRRVFDSYEILEELECQCISVEDDSHLYVTDDYLLTHNTLLACWHAAKRLHYGDVKKIVLIRAYQPLAGRSIGFLPGELQDKLKPFYQQMLDYFEDYLGKASTEIHLKNSTIEICSLETIRGRSWSDSIVIVDEAQSLFVPEVQALCTRVGENSQIIFCGDDSGIQTDVKTGMNGLSYLNKLVVKYNISDTAFVEFTRDEIVRSGLTKEFVIAFEEEMLADAKGTAIISQADQDKQFKKSR